MKINAPSRLKDTLHLDETDAHRHEIYHHRMVIGILDCHYNLVYLWILLRYFAIPAVFYILIRPDVFEFRPSAGDPIGAL